MTVLRSVAELLTERVTLEVESIDRMYLNLYVPNVQYETGVLGFFKGHRGATFASSALMDPITKDCVKAVKAFVTDPGVDLVTFEKGQRKDDVTLAHLADFDADEGVLLVGKDQEKTTAYRSEKRRNPETGKPYPWIVRATLWSTTTTSTVWTGTSVRFIKFCSYFPAPRGSLIYPPRSGVGLEVISQGAMADLDSKEEGDNSMPSEPALVPRRMGRGVGGPA